MLRCALFDGIMVGHLHLSDACQLALLLGFDFADPTFGCVVHHVLFVVKAELYWVIAVDFSRIS